MVMVDDGEELLPWEREEVVCLMMGEKVKGRRAHGVGKRKERVSI